MKYFSLPADFKVDTIDQYDECNQEFADSRVIETYGQLTVGNFLNSGRVIDALPEADVKTLENYFNYSQQKGIDFNYTLNPACMGNLEFSPQGVKNIKELLVILYNMGIRSLTVTLPSLFEMINDMGLDFKLRASAICEIMSPDKALFYKNLGAGKIVVDPDITRNFQVLKNICRVFERPVEIIINNVCYKNCAYKMFHYNHEAHRIPGHGSQTVTDYYFNRCAMQKARHLENVIRLNWIRPEDLKYYIKTGIHHFKIQGRQNVLRGDPVKALRHYMKENFDGNLYDLITLFAPYTSFQPYIDNKKLDNFVKTFFENPGFCKNTCDSCRYCQGYAQKSMDQEKALELNKQALSFFNETDIYTALHKKVSPGEPGEKPSFNKEELNFNFEN